MSRKEGWTNPAESNEKKNIKITDAKDLLNGKTAAALVYDTLLTGAAFVIDYFSYTEVPHFLDEIKMSQLSDKLMEGFFGKFTERTLGKNLRIGDMARRITNSAFT